MKYGKPQFELARVYSDGTQDEPEIVSVAQMPWDTRMQRRGFLGVGVGIASLLLLLDGKATSQITPTKQTENVPVKVPDKSLKAHRERVNALEISPDGKTLASGSFDGSIKLWSLPSGKFLTTLKNVGGQIYDLVISPDGKTLASSSAYNPVGLWSLPDGKFLSYLKELKSTLKLAFSPDGNILASGDWNKMHLWSLPEAKPLDPFEGNTLAFSYDGKIWVSHDYKVLRLKSFPEGKLVTTLETHCPWAAIGPDKSYLVCSQNTYIQLWSLREGKLLTTFGQDQFYGINALEISPDGKILASNWENSTIRIWSLPEGKPLTTLEGHKNRVRALKITSDGKTLISGDESGVIILWNLEKYSFIGFLFDPKENLIDAISYNQFDKISGRTITYTLPCGSLIPPGAVCTCNCVPGFRPPINTGGGTFCTCNKVCTCIPVPSDRDLKEAFEPTDSAGILQKLSELPINKWNHQWDDESIRHIGPMAQDFAAAFEVGDDDKHIHPVDAQGVAFAAIQGLYQLLKVKDKETESLKIKLKLQEKDNKELEARIEALEELEKEKFR